MAITSEGSVYNMNWVTTTMFPTIIILCILIFICDIISNKIKNNKFMFKSYIFTFNSWVSEILFFIPILIFILLIILTFYSGYAFKNIKWDKKIVSTSYASSIQLTTRLETKGRGSYSKDYYQIIELNNPYYHYVPANQVQVTLSNNVENITIEKYYLTREWLIGALWWQEDTLYKIYIPLDNERGD